MLEFKRILSDVVDYIAFRSFQIFLFFLGLCLWFAVLYLAKQAGVFKLFW